jgi:hypothetical protein
VPPPPLADREWRDVPGFEGLYIVSEYGDVWATKRQGSAGGPVKPTKRGPYWKVGLYGDGEGMEYRIHVLVAAAFLGPMPSDAVLVRHLDDDPRNNHHSNLAYGTTSDNLYDRYKNRRDK